MKKAIMQKWVKALRSGEFTQTKGTLKDNFGFCCLGVACEVGLTTPSDITNLYVHEDFLSEESQVFLSAKNDGRSIKSYSKKSKSWGFKRIANYIEKNYKRLK